MQATVTYLLTEQAQRAAMTATGQPVSREQVVTDDIPVDALDLMNISDKGLVTLNLKNNSYQDELVAAGWLRYGMIYAPAVKAIAEIIADLRTGKQILEQKDRDLVALTEANGEYNRRITEAAYQRFMADPSLRIPGGGLAEFIGEELRSPANWWPQDHDLSTEAARRNRADADTESARKAAIEQAKQNYIAQWVANSGDELLMQQFADGLACRRTIIKMIADHAFDEAGIPSEQPDSIVCRNNDCPCNDQVVDCLPAEIYSRWSEIRSRVLEASRGELLDLVGHGQITPREFGELGKDQLSEILEVMEFHKIRDCLRDEEGYWTGMNEGVESAGEPYYAADIRIAHGPFTFARRIRL